MSQSVKKLTTLVNMYCLLFLSDIYKRKSTLENTHNLQSNV